MSNYIVAETVIGVPLENLISLSRERVQVTRYNEETGVPYLKNIEKNVYRLGETILDIKNPLDLSKKSTGRPVLDILSKYDMDIYTASHNSLEHLNDMNYYSTELLGVVGYLINEIEDYSEGVDLNELELVYKKVSSWLKELEEAHKLRALTPQLFTILYQSYY